MSNIFTKQDCIDAKNKRSKNHIYSCRQCGGFPTCSVGQDFDQPRSMQDLQTELDEILADKLPEEAEIPDTPENREAFKAILKEISRSHKEEDEQ
jgi:hypothetical protein